MRTMAPPVDYAAIYDRATRTERQRALAVGRITRELRRDAYDAWARTSDQDRRAYASRVLFARLRLNRAGLLRWRIEPSSRASLGEGGCMPAEGTEGDGSALVASAACAVLGALLLFGLWRLAGLVAGTWTGAGR